MKYGDNYVITGPGIIMWDGITRPETKKDDKGQDYLQYSLKVALDSRSLEVQELTHIATAALQNDPKFRGQLPPGGNWPIVPIAPTDFEGKLPSHVSVNGKTTFLPEVFDVNNQKLPPQVYQAMLYPGSTVKLLLSAKSFDNKSKGVKFQLSGIMITDATTPRLPVGGVDAAAAFGGAAPAGPAAPPAYAPPPAPVAAPPLGPPAVPGPVMLPAANGMTYEQYKTAGWSDEQMVAAGVMRAPLAATPPTPPPAAPPVVVPPTHPNMQFVAGPTAAPAPPAAAPAPPTPPALAGPVMTDKAAGVTYEAFRAQGWTDQQLREQGYML